MLFPAKEEGLVLKEVHEEEGSIDGNVDALVVGVSQRGNNPASLISAGRKVPWLVVEVRDVVVGIDNGNGQGRVCNEKRKNVRVRGGSGDVCVWRRSGDICVRRRSCDIHIWRSTSSVCLRRRPGRCGEGSARKKECWQWTLFVSALESGRSDKL